MNDQATPSREQLLTEMAELRSRVSELETWVEKSRQSEERYRSVVTVMIEGVVMQQRSGEIVACNQAAERILGLTQEQMMGRTSVDPRWRAIHEDGTPFPGETHPAMVTLRTGQPQRNIIMGVHKPEGSLIWISINAEPLFQPGASEAYAVVNTFSDITAQRQAEELLRESERFARATLDVLPAHLCVLDENGVIMAVNHAWCEYAEAHPPVPANYGVGDNYLAVCDRTRGPDMAEAGSFATGIRAVMRGEAERFSREYPCPSPSELRWFIGLVTRFPGEGSVRVLVSHQDITDIKLAQEALAREQALLRTVIDLLPDRVYVKDMAGRKTISNQAEIRRLGAMTETEILGKTDADFYPPDLAAGFQADDQAVFQTGVSLLNREEINPDPAGQPRWVLTSKVPLCDETGQVIGLVGVSRDITERKQAEEALRASERKFRRVVERSNDAIILTDETGCLVEWNAAAEQIFGRKRAEMLGRTIWDNFFQSLPVEQQTPEKYEELKTRWLIYFQTGQHPTLNQMTEMEIRRPDSTHRIVQAARFSVKTEQGYLLGSVIRDVTARKQIERIEATQLAVSRILVRSPEAAVALRQVLEAIASHMGWQLAKLWWPDSSGSRLVWQDGWRVSYLPKLAEFERASQTYTFEPGEGVAGAVWQAGHTLWDKDMRLTKRPLAALAAAAGLCSASGIPIIRDDETVGVMTFFSRSAHLLDERLLAMLTDLGRQIGQFLTRKQAETERERLITELQAALTWAKQLEDILPICSFCKKIRGEDNQWYQMESYISLRSGIKFSHTFCPSCGKEHYPEYFAQLLKK